MLRSIAAGCVAAVVAGFGMGLASRALMRLIGIAAGGQTHFSWSGSFFICVIFSVARLPGALVAAMFRHRLRWLLLAIGAVFLCVPAWVSPVRRWVAPPR